VRFNWDVSPLLCLTIQLDRLVAGPVVIYHLMKDTSVERLAASLTNFHVA
jgi:hypothetical protein